MTNMKDVTDTLSLKNEECLKREEKVKILINQIEGYAREINKLKEDVMSRNTTIKEIKELYWEK